MRAGYLLLPLAALAMPLAAQGFEGTVSMNIPAAAGSMSDMQYFVKGDQLAMTAKLGANAGPMAGAEIRMIMDIKGAKMTMLIPLTGAMAGQFGAMGGGDMKGIKQVTDLNQIGDPKAGANAEVKALGTTEVIAGHKCEDFQITDEKSVTMMCLTKDMGSFAFASGGMGGRRGGAGSPAWANFFRSHPGFPLKVWDKDGKITLEVTKIEKGSVPASMFEVPDGYMDMGAMFGGRGGGRGGGQ